MTENQPTKEGGSEPSPSNDAVSSKGSDGPVRKKSIPDFKRYQRDSLELHEKMQDLEDEELEDEEEQCQLEASREKPWYDTELQRALAKFRKKSSGLQVRPVMEYELKDMYPEMSLLTDNKKRDWNFQDPSLIRALWLESKTNVLREWKFKNGKVSHKTKPKIEVRGTTTTEARMDYRRKQEQKQQQQIEKEVYELMLARDAPDFEPVEIATNLTTDLRLKFNKNDPSVPRFYLEHFQKYKKPPFRTAIPVGKRC